MRSKRGHPASADLNTHAENTDGRRTKRFYFGTRSELRPGQLIEPGRPPIARDSDTASYVYLTSDLDAAVWEAELMVGEGPARVYLVEPTGRMEDAPAVAGQRTPGHLRLSHRSRHPLRVTGEVTEWPLYHGTRADLKPGDLIRPGHTPNFGDRSRTTTHVYMTRTLDAATWGAELAVGEGPGRIYVVEPTGPIEEDPDLTNKKFRGNPTKSFRSREPLRVAGEIMDWKGHAPEVLAALKDGLERLRKADQAPPAVVTDANKPRKD